MWTRSRPIAAITIALALVAGCGGGSEHKVQFGEGGAKVLLQAPNTFPDRLTR